MQWLKRVLGLTVPQSQEQSLPDSGPLGIYLRCALDFDNTLGLLLDGQSSIRVPADQQVWAEGVIDLGEQHWLSRYYFDEEDFWLQIQSSGARNGQVENIILFNYLESVSVRSGRELEKISGSRSKIGLPTYAKDNVVFTREWGGSVGRAEFVPILECIVNPESGYSVQHRSMLYSRETGLTDRREFLLFSIEESEQGDITFSTSLGVSLSSTDLRVI